MRLVEGVPHILDGTLMDNLKWGNRFDHKDDEIWQLCARVGLSRGLIRKPALEVTILQSSWWWTRKIQTYRSRGGSASPP